MIIRKSFLVFLVAISVLLLSVSPAYAVIQSLNGLTVQNQSFVNDTNITIISSGSTHTLNWNGLLPISRGGTGASSFTDGSIPFISNGVFSENNSSLFWDDTNKELQISEAGSIGAFPIGAFEPWAFAINSALGKAIILEGSNISLQGRDSIGGDGSNIDLTAGSTDIDGTKGGEVNLTGGLASGDGDGGSIQFIAGSAEAVGNGGNIVLRAGEALNGSHGEFRFYPGGKDVYGVLDFGNLATQNRNFTFPDFSGTLGLLEVNQTFTGLNKFEASSNSTIYVGSSVKSGCIALGDSDGVGVTYVTANDGVLTVSTIKPSICQ